MNKYIFGAIVTLMMSCMAYGDPAERISATIQRNDQSGQSLRLQLSKNIERVEAYDAEYTVQVPYETTETYYVDVPYQTTESYVENVPYEVTVPYQDYEEYWDQEYRCKDVTRYREECRSENLCEPVPGACREVTECGTNAHGQPICKTRKVCDREERRCRDVRQCRQVPYSDRECGFEQVRKTRTVTRYRTETRYRQETRTRTVTRYRQEQRTRTVTKYRSENRCCVTKYRNVFDHQWVQNIVLVYPAMAQLMDNEMETVGLTLTGDESSPDVQVTFKNSVFNYSVVKKSIQGNELVVEIEAKEPLSAAQVGENSVQSLKMKFSGSTAFISFTDEVVHSRIQTEYSLLVAKDGVPVFEKQFVKTNNLIELNVGILDRLAKYDITLAVHRTGEVIVEKVVDFVKSTKYEKIELTQADIQLLKDKSMVGLLDLNGFGSEAILSFEDKTLDVDEVQTIYKAVIWRKSNGNIEWLGERNIERRMIPGDKIKQLSLRDAGLSEKTLKEVVRPGTSIYVDLVVKRQSAKYLGAEKVQLIVSRTFVR